MNTFVNLTRLKITEAFWRCQDIMVIFYSTRIFIDYFCFRYCFFLLLRVARYDGQAEESNVLFSRTQRNEDKVELKRTSLRCLFPYHNVTEHTKAGMHNF